MKVSPCLAGLLGMMMGVGAVASEIPAKPVEPGQAEFFENRIRPLLVANCVSCHGPQKQKGGLRLDSGPGLLKGGDAGPVVLPGDPEGSPLIEAVRYEGGTQMPPKGKLQGEGIADLVRWVDMGAPWPSGPSEALVPAGSANELHAKHWAFQPVSDPTPPEVEDRDWPRDAIDRFVLAKLEARGLAPSPSADKRTLIRRATFDLIGLPPAPGDVEAFEADASPDAFERVVDRLLASPHHGERWARHWLDVARYADTKGYVLFQDANFPWSYTYRDYVIRAFNEDLPFDRFVVEQIAADRLPLGVDRRPLTALGFLTLGGRFMGNRHDVIDDQIDVVTRGLMGLTVTCARCHDHKFDPIPTADYYSLYGVFASSIEPPVPPIFQETPRTEEYARYDREMEARERRLAVFVTAKHAEVVRSSRSRAAEYLMMAQAMRARPDTGEFMLLADAGDLNPKMALRWQAYLERTARGPDAVFSPWNALAKLPEGDFEAKAARLVEGLENLHPPINPLVVRALAEQPPRTLAEAARTYARLLNATEALWQEHVRRASLNGTEPGPLPDPAHEGLRQVFHAPDSPPNMPMNPIGDLELFPDRASQAELAKHLGAVETWRAGGPGAPPRAMVLQDIPEPVEPRVFVRGNPQNLGPAVPRRSPAVLAKSDRRPFREGSGRLELARAIVDPANPLTARVMVNRLWMHHFGDPLVNTPSDFGVRSDPPTHPELLDHLAARFVAGGWSIKALHRAILLSRVYGQASADRPGCRQVDPENTLLWRMNRRRLDFEATRDALLAASGRLDRAVGGTSMPDLTAPGSTRRTLYASVDRLNLPSLFRTFDFPDPNATSPRRDDTTIAPQALFLMNHPFVLESARALEHRPEVTSETDLTRRVERLYRFLYGRGPTVEEVELAGKYLAEGRAAVPRERYVHALMMANEFLFVD